MHVFVPFDATEPKTRLAPLLDAAERQQFARRMLGSVLDSLRAAGHRPEVLSTAAVGCDTPVTVVEKPLTPTVNDALTDVSLPVGIVMADLPLVRPQTLETLFEASADVVIAPGVGGGTNALVVDHPSFRVDYHGVSFDDHRQLARECGASTATVDSFRLALDIDEPADLSEVLLHGDGSVTEWLRERGFRIDAEDGRVTVTRIS